MASNLYWVIVGLLFLFGIWAAVMFYKQPSWALAMLLPLLVWLIFDPLVFALGNLLGEGSTLQVLHTLRYLLRAIATPFLLVIAYDQAKRAGVKGTDDPLVMIAVGILILVLITLGIVKGFAGFGLDPVELEGIKQYQPDTPLGLPLAPLLTLAIVVLLGVGTQLKIRVPWLLIGGGIMFLGIVTSALPLSLPTVILAFANPIFVFFVLLMEQNLQKISPNPVVR